MGKKGVGPVLEILGLISIIVCSVLHRLKAYNMMQLVNFMDTRFEASSIRHQTANVYPLDGYCVLHLVMTFLQIQDNDTNLAVLTTSGTKKHNITLH